MTADAIRKLLTDRISPEPGSLEYVWLAFACEIAAQLAEMNEKTAVPSPNWPELSAQAQMLDQIKTVAMRTCNSERDLAVVLETIRSMFYQKERARE